MSVSEMHACISLTLIHPTLHPPLLFLRFGLRGIDKFQAVEGQSDGAAFQIRPNMDRPFPQVIQVGERVLGVLQLQLNAAEAVLQVELAPVLVVAVLHIDDRPADVREIEQQPLFYLFKLTAFDFVVAAVGVVTEGKQLVLAAEIEGQKLVDEGQVVVDAADFEDFLPSQAGLFVSVFLF